MKSMTCATSMLERSRTGMGKEQWAEQRDHMRAMVEDRDLYDGWESPEVEQWARFFLYSLEAAVKKELPPAMMDALRKYADNLEKALAASNGGGLMLMLKAGDRVHHIGRKESGTVLPF